MFAFFGAPGFMELLIIGVFFVASFVFTILPFWLIFEKAGFSGALSLLMMVPVANVVMLFFLAFADWPALDRRGDAGYPSAGGNAEDYNA
ncbi:MAG: hypothetical protein JW888_00370 [Pirellulales bacterium]|nr:hypothetical protein [Pirellulales bacterium]